MKPKPFIHDDFLLDTRTARRLYHEVAAPLPIVDYHCHLPAGEIAADRRWDNLADIWLGGDHYKWRAMRANGVAERFCTGDADPWEKFEQWAATLPYLLGNPLYHWTHLELARLFGIGDRLLGPDTAREIWDACNAVLRGNDFSCRQLLAGSRVLLVCTTDDPADDLEAHRRIAEDPSCPTQVWPTWRPDRAMAVESPAAYNAYLERLGRAAGLEIATLDDLLAALEKRHAFFHERGCRISDHGIETAYGEECPRAEAARLFQRVRAGQSLEAGETVRFKSFMLHGFGVMDYERGWAQQYHFGALRNVNRNMFERLGPDTGYDSIGEWELARPLGRMLDRLAAAGRLTRTVIYTLNPAQHEVIATMLGNFQDGSEPGKMQMGSGWWFLDQIDGMRKQMQVLARMGLLSRFIGMLTDSRSFLSYPRHEYFRRILCALLGREAEDGLLPRDRGLLDRMVRDICFHNAVRYFRFSLPPQSS